jgi:hypothetical protein
VVVLRAHCEHHPHHSDHHRRAEQRAESGRSHVLVVDPESGHPMGMLSTLDIAAALAGRNSAEVSEQCPWWAPSKVAARWLTPWLAARDLQGRPTTPPRRLPTGGISRVASR